MFESAAASATQVAVLSNLASNGALASGALTSTGLGAINKTGTTQLRIYFAIDGNNDNGVDYVSFYSGNSGTASNRPQLVVEYQ